MKLRISILLILLSICGPLFGQNSEQYDFMRSIGKIYVVVAVILTIFIGIVLYLIRLDRKLTNLENQSL